MLKFHEIILRKFLALFFTLFILVGGIVYFWEYNSYLNASRDSLKQNLELISIQIQSPTNLDTLAQEVKTKLHLRLTIIDDDGNILAESHEDKTQMESHRYREEILQADKESFGEIIRHSKTLGKDLQYVAKKTVVNEKIVFIRLSRELKGIKNEMLQLGTIIFFALVLFFLAVLYFTYRINSQIEHEVNNIILFLKSLTKKQKSTYISSGYSKEFALITSLLTKVSQIIVKQEKKKSKYTQKLKALNKQKDDILSAISHEFKNPIAVVNGYSQTLIEDPQINPNIRQKFLTKIHNNGVKLSELIDTLRLSIKLDSKQHPLTLTSVDLYELVEDCVENLKLNYPDRDVVIEHKEEILIEADKTMFGIVLTNLIENAIKYSEDEVYVKLYADRIEVHDTGIGISTKDLENITNKFYRVHKHSWNNSLGLGLFLVDNITKLHHFKLSVESEENVGSTFTVSFA